MRKRIYLIIILCFICSFVQVVYFHAQRAERISLHKVPLWGQFEMSCRNSHAYHDPFRDVSLDVIYTRPDSSTIQFHGFYVGDQLWKFRFMPDQLGVWTYKATFSDGQAGKDGTFDVVPSDLHGPIVKDASNPRWFGFADGSHVLLRSFHCGDRFFAENWPEQERRAFLDWAEIHGYNLLSVASHYLNRDVPGRGQGWATPDLWDDEERKVNPAEYDQMEVILRDLAERKIMVFPFAGFFGQSSDFPRNPTDQAFYIRYTLSRIACFWNLLFNVAGPEPDAKPDEFYGSMTMDDVDHLGSLIDSLDIFNHLISIHTRPDRDDPFSNEEWSGYATLQGARGTDWQQVNRFMLDNHTGQKPVYAHEVFWPGNSLHQISTLEEVRKKAFVLLFSAATINLGDMNGNSSSGFSGSLDLSQCNQDLHNTMKGVWDWFERLPFYRMSPQQNLVSNGICLAQEGICYAVYLPEGGITTLNLKSAKGQYTLRWYNPRIRSYQESDNLYNGNQPLTLESPSDEDWVVLLNRTQIPIHKQINGIISIEAEHYVAGTGWCEVEGISGTAMRDPDDSDSGHLVYEIEFNQAGDYWVYGLMRRTDLEHADRANDTFFDLNGWKLYGIDGKTRPDGLRCTHTDFTWQSGPKGPGPHTPRDIIGQPVYVHIPGPGRYSVHITKRSIGFEIDKFVFLPENIAPQNSGPDETLFIEDNNEY
ncbi:DUF5060 domain-containing protein [bacterium]|nr:DUF5060 domain-containing protein [bacterium]